MPPRKKRSGSKESSIEHIIEQVAKLVGKGGAITWPKLVAGVVGIAIVLFGYAGIKGDVAETREISVANSQELDRQSERIDELEDIDENIRRLQRETNDLGDVLESIKKAISRSVIDSLLEVCEGSGAGESPFCRGLTRDTRGNS